MSLSLHTKLLVLGTFRSLPTTLKGKNYFILMVKKITYNWHYCCIGLCVWRPLSPPIPPALSPFSSPPWTVAVSAQLPLIKTRKHNRSLSRSSSEYCALSCFFVQVYMRSEGEMERMCDTYRGNNKCIYFSIYKVIKSRRIRWAGQMPCKVDNRKS
jgi:hypothetical protein